MPPVVAAALLLISLALPLLLSPPYAICCRHFRQLLLPPCHIRHATIFLRWRYAAEPRRFIDDTRYYWCRYFRHAIDDAAATAATYRLRYAPFLSLIISSDIPPGYIMPPPHNIISLFFILSPLMPLFSFFLHFFIIIFRRDIYFAIIAIIYFRCFHYFHFRAIFSLFSPCPLRHFRYFLFFFAFRWCWLLLFSSHFSAAERCFRWLLMPLRRRLLFSCWCYR